MAQSRPGGGHAPQPSVANAASLFGAGGGEDSDPFATISSPPAPAAAPQLGTMSEEQEDGGAADLFGDGQQNQQYNQYYQQQYQQQQPADIGSQVASSSSGLFGNDAATANDDWLGGGGDANAGYDQCQQQQPYDPSADSTSWYDGAGAQQTDYSATAQSSSGYDAYGQQQQQYPDSNYYQQQSYDAGAYDPSQYQQQQDQSYQQWDSQQQQHQPGYDNYYTSGAGDSTGSYAYHAPQQQYAPPASQAHGYDAQASAGQYDYSAATQSQGQYDHTSANGYDASQQSQQQDYYGTTSYDPQGYALQSADGYQQDQYAANYGQYDAQQADPPAQGDYDAYNAQQQQQWNSAQTDYPSQASQQYQPSQQYDASQPDPYAPPATQSQYEPSPAASTQYDPSSTPRASGIDLPPTSQEQPRFTASEMSYENSYDAQLQTSNATTDAYGAPPTQAASHEETTPAAATAPANAYSPSQSASPSMPAAPPKGPPKGPPRGPPRGPARGPSRTSSSKAIPQQPAAAAPAPDEPTPQSPALQLNGLSTFDGPAAQHAPSVTAAASEEQPAPWDVASTPAADAASSSTDGASLFSPPADPASGEAPSQLADPDDSETSLAPPPRSRQATPKLLVTGDDDSTKEIEVTPSPDEEYPAADQTIIERRDSLASQGAGRDDDLDEATREFNDLQLISRSKSQSSGSGASTSSQKEVVDASRPMSREVKKGPDVNAKKGPNASVRRGKGRGKRVEEEEEEEDWGWGVDEVEGGGGYGGEEAGYSGDQASREEPIDQPDPYAPPPVTQGQDQYAPPSPVAASGDQDPYAPPAAAAGASETYEPEAAADYGYGYDAGYGREAEDGGDAESGDQASRDAAAESHDAYAPPSTSEGQDPYAPTPGSASQGYESEAATGYGYGYEAGYGGGSGEEAGAGQDPYAPQVQGGEDDAEAYVPRRDADPYAPQEDEDLYAPPDQQTDPYAPSATGQADAYAPSKAAEADPYAPPATSEHDPYGPPPTSHHEQDPYGPAIGSQYGSSSSSAAKQDLYAPSASNADPYAPINTSSRGAYNPYEPAEQSALPTQDPYAPPISSNAVADPYAPSYGTESGSQDAGWGSSLGGADGAYAAPPMSRGYGSGASSAVPDTPLASRAPAAPSSAGYSAYGPPSHHGRSDSQSGSVFDEGAAGPYGPSAAVAGGAGYFGSRAPSSSYSAAPHEAASPYELPREREQGFEAGYADAPDPAEEKRNARIPLACFGVDGKIVTFFPTQSHASSGLGDGYGYGSDTAPPTKVSVRQLSNLVPPTAFASSFDPLLFPGPAFESTAVTSAIARATGAGSSVSTSVKSKKTTLIKFLRDAAADLEAGMGYRRRRPSVVDAVKPHDVSSSSSSAGDEEAGKAEDRILLIRLLAIMLEQDGNVANNAAFDEAVRALLAGEQGAQQSSTFAPGYADPKSSTGNGASGTTLHSYEVTSKHLEQIRDLLVTGQRREAVAYATSQRLWSHAMVIASAVDQETWRRVASDFIEAELSGDAGDKDASLKLAYGLFSGQEPSMIQTLFRPDVPPSAASSSQDWRNSAAVILANRCAGDSTALTAMGDALANAGRQEAAHICYLLSPRTSSSGGVDAPNARMSLLGAPSPLASTSYLRDMDAFILSEIYEFSFALVPPLKGQEAFPGLAHLQAYRLLHALQLAELGETKRAQKYCEAIAGVMKATKQSPYFHRTLVAQVKELSDRLIGGPQLDSGGNWVTRKMQRPTLDGMLSAFEGRFAKFIAGDDDSPASGSATPNGGGMQQQQQGGGDKSRGAGSVSGLPSTAGSSVGAFSHYSAITPDAMSGGISRVQSFADFSGAGISRPGSRAQSAAGFRQHGARSPSFMQQQQDRAVSAMGSGAGPYGVPPSSAGGSPYLGWSRSDSPAPAGHHQQQQQQQQYQQGPYGRSSVEASEADAGAAAPWPGQSGPGEEQPNDDGAGYQGPSYGYDADNETPSGTRPQFISNLDADFGEAGNGGDAEGGGGADFVSPMDAFTPAGAASFPSYTPASHQQHSSGREDPIEDDDDDDDDLGFGNSAHRRNRTEGDTAASHDEQQQREPSKHAEEESNASTPTAAAATSSAAKQPELKPSPSTSWLGRLWGRKEPAAGDAAATKAAQAHMGEESAFYYDKDLKRWVNKKAGDTGGAATPPPPPPRATTASPSMASRGGPGGAPAPQRSFSAANSRTNSSQDLGNDYRSGAAGGPGGPPRAASSAFSSSARGTPPIAESDRTAANGTPPPSEGGPPYSTMSSPGAGSRGGMGRTRSNLGDLNQPAAMQPAMGAAAAGGGPPGSASSSMPPPPAPPAGRGAGAKKKPISKRYVRVD
ncbi:hypothetical protein BDZ90DRAFT_231966 [Jaminaea rosea]|uniref:Protein transport protein sec16 n=1 Tax=Jaminaea rosea TaxID=1569628 RepID=A0A316USF2_9BASI|nr:hypothetical protein BDZ90DRAFT_231966 [Jaminaea rosea]PWN28217.1 hypothetical protein BDZ90DRAFT_231966 [Jaminaea rosea]